MSAASGPIRKRVRVTKIKPFANSGSHTVFDNAILDYIMPECPPNTWKIVCTTIRKTRGWQKEEDWISISQYMKLTGIKNRTTCHKAIQDALKKGYLIRKRYRTQSFKYSLNRQYEICTSTETVPVTSTKSVPVASTDSVPTKETITKDISTKEIKELIFTNDIKESFVLALSEVTGIDASIRTNFGRLAKDGKELFEGGYSPDDITEIFGPGGPWWRHHWKGRKNQKPTTKDIRENIKDLQNNHSRKKYEGGKFAEFVEN